jgi:hypothetical protein
MSAFTMRAAPGCLKGCYGGLGPRGSVLGQPRFVTRVASYLITQIALRQSTRFDRRPPQLTHEFRQAPTGPRATATLRNFEDIKQPALTSCRDLASRRQFVPNAAIAASRVG